MKRSVCMVLFLFATLGVNAAMGSNDIRVIIDVSGSMKKTDPLNLRVPAVKLLNGLLPEGVYAGVWSFGRYVDVTASWGKVDRAWRERADAGTARIHSNGLYTDIEGALTKATRDWEQTDADVQRSVILLTDGRVDISKDDARNERSRQAVLTHSIQRLQQLGAKVHTIALSSDADEALLQQLALDTGGSFKLAESATELQKIFLRLFERAANPNTIALTDNQFKVDKSIKEMTLLIFRPKNSQVTRLFPPGSPLISARKKGRSSWRSEDGYDLITIANPKVGIWGIDAYSDPDNRLMVVTDLKLNVADIPAFITPADRTSIFAELFNKDKKISKNSFLRFVNFGLTHIDEAGEETQLSLTHSQVREDKGQYLHVFEESLAEGEHRFLVTVDSQTFSRSKGVDVTVQWPVKVDIRSVAKPSEYQMTIQAREAYLKPDSLQPSVQIQTPDGEKNRLVLENVSGIWQAQVSTNQEGIYQAFIQVSAESVAGESQRHDLGAFPIVGVYQAPQVMSEPVEDTDVIDAPIPTPEQADDGMFWIIVVVVNVLLILIIGGGFWAYRRHANKALPSLDDDFVNDNQPAGA